MKLFFVSSYISLFISYLIFYFLCFLSLILLHLFYLLNRNVAINEVNVGYDKYTACNFVGGGLSIDVPGHATSGSLSLVGTDPNPVSVGVEWNVGGPSKNLLISAGLNVSSDVNAIRLVKVDDNYNYVGNVQLDSLGKVRGQANVTVDVESISKW